MARALVRHRGAGEAPRGSQLGQPGRHSGGGAAHAAGACAGDRIGPRTAARRDPPGSGRAAARAVGGVIGLRAGGRGGRHPGRGLLRPGPALREHLLPDGLARAADGPRPAPRRRAAGRRAGDPCPGAEEHADAAAASDDETRAHVERLEALAASPGNRPGTAHRRYRAIPARGWRRREPDGGSASTGPTCAKNPPRASAATHNPGHERLPGLADHSHRSAPVLAIGSSPGWPSRSASSSAHLQRLGRGDRGGIAIVRRFGVGLGRPSRPRSRHRPRAPASPRYSGAVRAGTGGGRARGVIPPGMRRSRPHDGLRMRAHRPLSPAPRQPAPRQLLLSASAAQRSDWGPISAEGFAWYPFIRLGELTDLPATFGAPTPHIAPSGGSPTRRHRGIPPAPRPALPAPAVSLAILEAMQPWSSSRAVGPRAYPPRRYFGCGSCGHPPRHVRAGRMAHRTIPASCRSTRTRGLGRPIRSRPRDRPRPPSARSFASWATSTTAAGSCAISPGDPSSALDPLATGSIAASSSWSSRFEVTGTDRLPLVQESITGYVHGPRLRRFATPSWHGPSWRWWWSRCSSRLGLFAGSETWRCTSTSLDPAPRADPDPRRRSGCAAAASRS